MFHYLPESSGEHPVNARRRSVQLGRWNAGSLVLHRDSAPDVANLLLVVDAMRYGMMELAGCALCLWAIPYFPHRHTGDPFTPFYVPTSDLLFPHDKGLVIRCMEQPARSAGTSVILPTGAAGYTATAGPGSTAEQRVPSGRECTHTTENNLLHCGCPDGLCIPEPGRTQ